MPNRFASETRPYLRQHAGNPVDWWPWRAEALALARAQDVTQVQHFRFAITLRKALLRLSCSDFCP